MKTKLILTSLLILGMTACGEPGGAPEICDNVCLADQKCQQGELLYCHATQDKIAWCAANSIGPDGLLGIAWEDPECFNFFLYGTLPVGEP